MLQVFEDVSSLHRSWNALTRGLLFAGQSGVQDRLYGRPRARCLHAELAISRTDCGLGQGTGVGVGMQSVCEREKHLRNANRRISAEYLSDPDVSLGSLKRKNPHALRAGAWVSTTRSRFLEELSRDHPHVQPCRSAATTEAEVSTGVATNHHDCDLYSTCT
jgi:hypothetical protein